MAAAAVKRAVNIFSLQVGQGKEETLSRFPTPSRRVGKGVRNYSVCMRI